MTSIKSGIDSSNLNKFSPVQSTVKIDIFSPTQKISGHGVIVDSNSILTAAHVLTNLKNPATLYLDLTFIVGGKISTKRYDVNDVEAQILKDPDPDGDGEASIQGIATDLGVVGSSLFSFEEINFPTLRVPKNQELTLHPTYKYRGDTLKIDIDKSFSKMVAPGVIRTDENMVSGESGSGLFSGLSGDQGLFGIVSTNHYSNAFTDKTIEQISSMMILDNEAKEISRLKDEVNIFEKEMTTVSLSSDSIVQPIASESVDIQISNLVAECGFRMNKFFRPLENELGLDSNPTRSSFKVEVDLLLTEAGLVSCSSAEKMKLVTEILSAIAAPIEGVSNDPVFWEWAMDLTSSQLIMAGVNHYLDNTL